MAERRTVQMEPATHVRLISYRARLEIAAGRDPCKYPPWMSKGRVSLDDAISWLLDKEELRVQRASRVTARRREERRTARNQAATDGPAPGIIDPTGV